MRRFCPPVLFAVLTALAWADHPAAAEPITVLSYNVENWLTTDRYIDNQRVPAAPKPDKEKDAAVAIIAAHRPAIVGVVEMGSRDDLDDLRARLKAKGLDYPYAEWHEGIDAARHVALLSRFPIIARHSQDHVALDIGGRPNAVQRGILDVTVEPEAGHPLRLIGLHLKSRRKVPEVDESILRAKEAWAVRQYLDTILAKEPDARILLFGDLNDTKDQYPIRELIGPRGAPTRMTDIPIEDSRGERWTHYFTVADEYARIDYFLASPALAPAINRKKSGIDDSPGWHDASDHRAIFVTISHSGK